MYIVVLSAQVRMNGSVVFPIYILPFYHIFKLNSFIYTTNIEINN